MISPQHHGNRQPRTQDEGPGQKAGEGGLPTGHRESYLCLGKSWGDMAGCRGTGAACQIPVTDALVVPRGDSFPVLWFGRSHQVLHRDMVAAERIPPLQETTVMSSWEQASRASLSLVLSLGKAQPGSPLQWSVRSHVNAAALFDVLLQHGEMISD